MYPVVERVAPNEDFTLTNGFDNGEEGVLDLTPHLGFRESRKIADLQSFKQVRVSFDTIEWGSGVDLDPESVYAKCRMTTGAR